jgi:hypothetical protein
MRRHDLREGRSGGWGEGRGWGEGGRAEEAGHTGRCPLWSKIAEIWPGALGLPDLHSVQYTIYTDRNIYTSHLQYTKKYTQLEPQAHGLIIAKG